MRARRSAKKVASLEYHYDTKSGRSRIMCGISLFTFVFADGIEGDKDSLRHSDPQPN